MSKRNGNGTATELAREVKDPRIAKHYRARAWVLVQPIKPVNEPRVQLMAATAPATTSSVSANRYPTMLTLCYTLHSAQPITYVTVTITGIVTLPGGGKMAGQVMPIPAWSIYLPNPSTDVSLPVTALPLSQTPDTNPMLITITYDTATQQNIPLFTGYV